jgi:tetratricopeptide (TPR) repeat protein
MNRMQQRENAKCKMQNCQRLFACCILHFALAALTSCSDLPLLQPQPTATPTVLEQATTLYEQGNQLFDQGEYQAAIGAYDQALALDATNARAFNNRALAYQALGQIGEARADFVRAVQADPTYLRAYKNHVALLEQTGEDPATLAAIEGRLAELEPAAAAQHRYRQGVALHETGDLAGARQAYDAALAADSQHVDALYERALLSLAEGRPADAVTDLDRALQLSPRAANAFYARALAHLAAGSPPAALADLDRALELRPAYPEALLARADLALAADDQERARRDLDSLGGMPLDEQLEAAAAALRRRLE